MSSAARTGQVIGVLVAVVLMFVVVPWLKGVAERLGGRARINRALRRRQCVAIAAVARHGEIKVGGRTGIATRALIAPISGRPCIYFKVVVEQLPVENELDLWKTVVSEEDRVDFLVADRTGVALVEAAGADFAAAFDHDSTLERNQDEIERRLLARHQVHGNRVGRRMRFREAAIVVGAEVAVRGACAVADAAGSAGGVPLQLRFSAGRTRLLVGNDESVLL